MIEITVLSSRLALGILFLVASASKVRRHHFDLFVSTVRQLVPANLVGLARPIGRAVVGLEFVIGLSLLIPQSGALALAAAAGILAVFAVVLSVAYYRHRRISCMCFGVKEGQLRLLDIVRDGLLLATALLGLAFSVQAGSMSSPSVWIVSGPIAVLLAGLVLRLEDLVDLFSPVQF